MNVSLGKYEAGDRERDTVYIEGTAAADHLTVAASTGTDPS